MLIDQFIYRIYVCAHLLSDVLEVAAVQVLGFRHFSHGFCVVFSVEVTRVNTVNQVWTLYPLSFSDENFVSLNILSKANLSGA